MLKCQAVFFPPRKLVECLEVTLLWAGSWEQESKSESLWDSSLGLGGEVLPCPAPCRAWGAVCLAEGPLGGEKQEGRERMCQCFPGLCRELWY